MKLFNEYQELKLSSGTVRVQKGSLQFRRWIGVPPKRTHGNKPYIEWEGSATFAEIALISVLKQHGFTGAVWRDNWRQCFRAAMPPAKCDEPDAVRELCSRIRARMHRDDWSGCWDVLAWNQNGVTFIECKKAKGSDRINPNQIRWLEAALQEGLTEDNFAICEWEFERGV